MGVQLLDGTGSGRLAKVDERNRLHTEAVATSPLENQSEINGTAAFFNSTYSATGGQEVIYIQNTEASDKLHIQRLVISSSAASLFTFFEVTSTTAAGGTALTPINPNLGSAVTKNENSFGNASVTGSLSGTTLLAGSIGVALIDYPYEFDAAVILGNLDAVALTLTTTGVVFVHIQGFWGVE